MDCAATGEGGRAWVRAGCVERHAPGPGGGGEIGAGGGDGGALARPDREEMAEGEAVRVVEGPAVKGQGRKGLHVNAAVAQERACSAW